MRYCTGVTSFLHWPINVIFLSIFFRVTSPELGNITIHLMSMSNFEGYGVNWLVLNHNKTTQNSKHIYNSWHVLYVSLKKQWYYKHISIHIWQQSFKENVELWLLDCCQIGIFHHQALMCWCICTRMCSTLRILNLKCWSCISWPFCVTNCQKYLNLSIYPNLEIQLSCSNVLYFSSINILQGQLYTGLQVEVSWFGEFWGSHW